MASPALEIKKMEVEIMRAEMAKAEIECKILEKMEDIERMEEHSKLQIARIAELKEKIAVVKTA